MKKISLVILLVSILLLSAFTVNAKNEMLYFKTVHIIELTPEEMASLEKQSEEKQTHCFLQNTVPVNNLLEYLRSR